MRSIASLSRLSLGISLVLMGIFVLMGFASPLCAQQTPSTSSPAAADTLEGKRSYAFPLVYDPLLIPFPLVYVSINEQAPMPFILDTGSSITLAFTPQAAKTLHLVPTGKTGLVNHKVKAPMTKVSSIRFPLAGINPQDKMIPMLNPQDASPLIVNLPSMPPTPDGKPIAGIVGVIAFMKTTICLDFAARMLTVYPDAHPPLHFPNAAMLPLNEQKGGLYTVTLQSDASHAYDFLLDTGCAITEAPPAATKILHVRETPIAYSSRFIGGSQENMFGLLPSLPLGTLTPREVGVAYLADEKSKGRAILGMNVLSRYRLTFDFPNKQLHLQPGADYEAVARIPGLTGLRLTRKGTQIRVVDVLPGSAASRAGIRKGDVVLSAEEVPLQGLSDMAVENVINGYGDTQARLQVQQAGGQTRVITFRRYSMAVVAVGVDVGLDVHMSEAGRLFVDGAEKGFFAYLAGMRKGDEILAIDGQSVQTTDYEALLNALNNPQTNPLPISLQRKGEDQTRQVLLKWR